MEKDKKIRLGIVSVASPLEVGADQAPIILKQLQSTLINQYNNITVYPYTLTKPLDAINIGRIFYNERVQLICVIAASWFEDYLVLDLLEECDAPVMLWGIPGMETGSLCGTQQLGFILNQIGKPYKVIYEPINSKDAIEILMKYTSACALKHYLRRTKIGYLGYRVEGMTETTGHEIALKKIFGSRVISIDSQLFSQEVDNFDARIAEDKWNEIKSCIHNIKCKDEDGIESMKIYFILKSFAKEKMLDAIAIGCYPRLMGKICLPASLLGEEGIPIACEGDINGGLGMIMLSWLSSTPIHNTDLLDPIPEDNAIVFSHCGSGGFSLSKSYSEITLSPVRLIDSGVCCLFPAKSGYVTMINIVPTIGNYKIGILEGNALETNMVFPGNPIKVKFDHDYRNILSWIVKEGLGHHWMIAYGSFKSELIDLASMIGCELACI